MSEVVFAAKQEKQATREVENAGLGNLKHSSAESTTNPPLRLSSLDAEIDESASVAPVRHAQTGSSLKETGSDFKPSPKQALILAHLKSEDPSLRKDAFEEIWNMDQRMARPFLPAVVQAMRDESKRTEPNYLAAVSGAAALWAHAPEAAMSLMDPTMSPLSTVRRAIVNGMDSTVGRSYEARMLRALALDPSPGVREMIDLWYKPSVAERLDLAQKLISEKSSTSRNAGVALVVGVRNQALNGENIESLLPFIAAPGLLPIEAKRDLLNYIATDVQSLPKYLSPKSLEILRHIALTETDKEQAAAAICALSTSNSYADEMKHLIRKFLNDPSIDLQLRAIEACDRYGPSMAALGKDLFNIAFHAPRKSSLAINSEWAAGRVGYNGTLLENLAFAIKTGHLWQ